MATSLPDLKLKQTIKRMPSCTNLNKEPNKRGYLVVLTQKRLVSSKFFVFDVTKIVDQQGLDGESLLVKLIGYRSHSD